MGQLRPDMHSPGDSKQTGTGSNGVKTHLLFKEAVVIGGGCSGIQAAIQLQNAGCKVRILEQGSGFGGSWLTCDSKAELQCPWEEFCFPDFPWPDHCRPSSPQQAATADQVRSYIQAYAVHHGLLKRARFNCRDVKVSFHGCTQAGSQQQDENLKWRVSYQYSTRDKPVAFGKKAAAFIVVATGLHANPVIPTVEKHENFFGQQLHARDLINTAGAQKLLEGKGVVMFGSGHGLNETLAESLAAQHAESVSYVNRQVYWPVASNKLLSTLHADAKSLASLRAEPYYTEAERAIGCTPGMNPLKAVQLFRARKQLKNAFNMSKVSLKPCQSLDKALLHGPQFIWRKEQWAAALQRDKSDGYRSEVYKGRAKRFHCNGVILDTNEMAPADVVVYCTGYAQDYSSILEASLLEKLEPQQDGLYLYRSVVHPRFPSLAFIGCAADTHNPMVTARLQSKWLVSLWSLEMPSPSASTMYRDIYNQCMWRRKHLPAALDRSAQYGMYTSDYWRQLEHDISTARPIPLPQHVDDTEIKMMQHGNHRQYSTESMATSTASSSRATAPIPAVWQTGEGSRTGQTSTSGVIEQPSPVTSAGGILNAVKGMLHRLNMRSSPGTTELSPAARHGSCIQTSPRQHLKAGGAQPSSKSFTAGVTPSPRPPRPSKSRLSTATQIVADQGSSTAADVAKPGSNAVAEVANTGVSPGTLPSKNNRPPSAQISRTSLARTATLQAGLQAHQQNAAANLQASSVAHQQNAAATLQAGSQVHQQSHIASLQAQLQANQNNAAATIQHLANIGLAWGISNHAPTAEQPPPNIANTVVASKEMADANEVQVQVASAPKPTTCRLGSTMAVQPERNSPRRPSGPAMGYENSNVPAYMGGHVFPDRRSLQQRRPSGAVYGYDNTHENVAYMMNGRRMSTRSSNSNSTPEIAALGSRDASRSSRTSCPASPSTRSSRGSNSQLNTFVFQAPTSRKSLNALKNSLMMDATSAGLLKVVEDKAKSGILPKTYTERSYNTLLRNSAVGLEPQGF